jgi:hypothetical protein
MQMLSITPESGDIPAQAIVCHDVRNPAHRNDVLVRKGSSVTATDVTDLLARGVQELHLALADADDVGENPAALSIASAVAGLGVVVDEAHFGQTNLVSSLRGLLRVDATRLEHINALDGVLVLSAEADRPVETGTTVGVVKCAPLFLAGDTLLSAKNLATGGGPVVEVTPFQPMRAALVAPRERLRGGAFERAQLALSAALEWYGSSLSGVVGAEASLEALSVAYRTVRDDGAELILAAGASGTDPLDVVFEALRAAGGDVIQVGIPAEPGTACWIGRLGSIPVLGLASCELFGQPGALDLLLPRLHTGDSLDQQLLRRLALGGLLLGPSRIAPYHATPSSMAAK